MRLSRNFTFDELVASDHTDLVPTMSQIPPRAGGLFAAADFFFSTVKAADAFEHIGETPALFDRLCLYPNQSRLHVDIREDDQRSLLYIDKGKGWVKQ